MATKLENLERALLTRALLNAGKIDEVKEILDEVIDEARSARIINKTKLKDE